MTTNQRGRFHFSSECAELFGEGWQYEVARRLGVQARSVKRWANGESQIPDEVEAFVRFWRKGLTNE